MWEKWALFFHAPGVLKNFHVFQLNFRFITTLSQNSKETLTLGSLVIIEHGSFNAHAKQAHFFQKKKKILLLRLQESVFWIGGRIGCQEEGWVLGV